MTSEHWFPGHMAKAIAEIKTVKSQIDLVIEVVDARLPDHTRNPIIDQILADKPRLIFLNKEDLADPRATTKWLQYFKAKGHHAIALNSQQSSAKKTMLTAIKAATPPPKKTFKFIVKLPTKAIVIGIPNVGKSTVINHLIGKNKAKTANKAGVTKDLSWLQGDSELMLLDSPGILWKRFDDPNTANFLSCINCFPDVLIETQSKAIFLCDLLQYRYPGIVAKHFGLEASSFSSIITTDSTSVDLLTEIARKRGYVSGPNEIDEDRLYATFIREFHTGKMGRLTLTVPH